MRAPASSRAAWRAELEAAIARAGEHLSLYQLTFEPGTPFEALRLAGKLAPPGGGGGARRFTRSRRRSAGSSMACRPMRSGPSAAHPGAESRHNLVYWRYGEYAGVGPGAHGRLVTREGRQALATERHPEAWLTRGL